MLDVPCGNVPTRWDDVMGLQHLVGDVVEKD